MKKIPAAAAAALIVASLVGCAGGPSAEDEFLSAVRTDLETGFSDSELLGVAREACEAVADGGGQQALQRLILASGLAPYDYGLVVGHGTTYLCPDQSEAFQTITGG
jgi:hypothetical protein